MSWGQYFPPGFIVRQRDGAGKAPSLGADPQVHRVSGGLFLLLLSLFPDTGNGNEASGHRLHAPLAKTCLEQRQVSPVLNWVTACARGVHVSLVRGAPPTALPGSSHDAAQARQGRNSEPHVRKESSDRHAVSHMLSAVARRFTGVILQVLPTACRDGGHHPTLQMRGLRPVGLVSPAQVTQPVHGWWRRGLGLLVPSHPQ